LKKAGSSVGHKVEDETKKRISLGLKKFYKINIYKSKLGKSIRVVNVVTNDEIIFESIRHAARDLKTSHKTILKYIANVIVYKNIRFYWYTN
jgi:hypothetical protein